MALRSGVSVDEAVEAMRHAHNIPGRMQRISNRDGVRALTIVDYAHTPEALEWTLRSTRELTPRQSRHRLWHRRRPRRD